MQESLRKKKYKKVQKIQQVGEENERFRLFNKDFKLIRFNDKYASVPKEIKEKSISVNENINEVINKIIENEE